MAVCDPNYTGYVLNLTFEDYPGTTSEIVDLTGSLNDNLFNGVTSRGGIFMTWSIGNGWTIAFNDPTPASGNGTLPNYNYMDAGYVIANECDPLDGNTELFYLENSGGPSPNWFGTLSGASLSTTTSTTTTTIPSTTTTTQTTTTTGTETTTTTTTGTGTTTPAPSSCFCSPIGTGTPGIPEPPTFTTRTTEIPLITTTTPPPENTLTENITTTTTTTTIPSTTTTTQTTTNTSNPVECVEKCNKLGW